jgi:hypothetical protein
VVKKRSKGEQIVAGILNWQTELAKNKGEFKRMSKGKQKEVKRRSKGEKIKVKKRSKGE